MSFIIFFDIGETLGTVSPTISGLLLKIFPGVENILKELSRHARLGIVSKIGEYSPSVVDKMLGDSNLLDYFEPALLHYIRGETPKNKAEFLKAISKAQPAVGTILIYIGENAEERRQAELASMRVGASPSDALNMLNDRPFKK